MYKKNIPHTNFAGKPRNQEVQFNLTEHEVFKLLVEFQAIFEWQKKLEDNPDGQTDTAEVIEFYNNLEEILLSAYGELDESGDHFRKAGRYEFSESSKFHACMKMFVEDPSEANKLLDGLMPKGLQEMVKKADANLAELAKNPDSSDELKLEIERLRARQRELEANSNTTPAS